MQQVPAQFEDHAIRRVYDEATDSWWFSIVDIMQVLTQQPDFLAFPSACSAPPRDPKSCSHAEARRARRMTKTSLFSA